MAVNASVKGFLSVQFTCADIASALHRISNEGIQIHNVTFENDLTVLFSIKPEDFPVLRNIGSKIGAQIEVKKKQGLYWLLRGVGKRRILILGILLILLATYLLPRRIFFLRVDGNQRVPTRCIMEAAEKSGIVFGASRSEVRSERVKNAMLEKLPDLQWAGINTYGCLAVISVRERTGEEPRDNAHGFGHVVAIRDGVIVSCNATKGDLVCAPGQAVARGEILISGYTDCGLSIRAEQAEGEIYGMTNRLLTVKTPLNRILQHSNGTTKKKISLIIGKKRLNLWKDSGISHMVCDRMYAEYYVTLPGGFSLPLALCIDRYDGCTAEQSSAETEELRKYLADFSRDYLTSQMIGGTIRMEQLRSRTTEDSALLEGEYVCIELIGKMQREMIGEENGQSD